MLSIIPQSAPIATQLARRQTDRIQVSGILELNVHVLQLPVTMQIRARARRVILNVVVCIVRSFLVWILSRKPVK